MRTSQYESQSTAEGHPDRHLFTAYLLLLIWLPLPLGSNRSWSWGIMEVGCFMLAGWWCLLYLNNRKLHSQVWNAAKPAIFLFMAWIVVVVVQLVPLPLSLIEVISPNGLALKQLYGIGISSENLLILSVDAYATATFLLKSIAYFILFILTLVLVNRYDRVITLLRVAVLCGVFQAIYGGISAMSDLQNASGTFVNRNHFAGFLEICLALGTGLLMSDLGGGEGASWRQRTRALIRWIVSPKMSLRILLAIMVIGLVLSRSRMGNSAFFTSLLITGGIWLVFSRAGSKKIGLFVLVSILIVDIYLLGQWFGIEKVVQRIQQTTMATENRDEISLETVDYWRDYLWSGSGGGTFYSIFPKYRGTEASSGYFLHAHNDYLEILVETGVIGLGTLAGIVILSFFKAFQAIRTRRQPLMRGLGFGVIMGIVALMIHSTVDFNLQIPGVTAWFVVLLALGWVAANLREEPRRKRKSISNR